MILWRPSSRCRRQPARSHAVHAAEPADVILACEQGEEGGGSQHCHCDSLHCRASHSLPGASFPHAEPEHLPRSMQRLPFPPQLPYPGELARDEGQYLESLESPWRAFRKRTVGAVTEVLSDQG